MRIFIFLLCSTVFSFTPGTSFSQETVIIDKNQTVPVDQVFRIIQQQTNYHFVFPKKLFNNAPNVALEKGEILVVNLLNKSLQNSNLSFEIEGSNTILIKKNIPLKNALQEKITITGKVMDAKGIPLAGVTVLELGTNNGVATNFDGNYSIKAANNATIEFSYIGFKTETIKVADLSYFTDVNITLTESVSKLDEVIVTGYQVLSKERTAGSFERATATELTLRPSSPNILQRIEGQVTGVQLSGATGLINLRGRSTIFSSQETPLIVVDGFPLSDQEAFNIASNLEAINPEDVESIDILKDASAASIWGARAANGVIVITTKKGKKDKKTTVDFSTFVEVEEKIDTDDYLWMNTAQEIELDQEYIDKGWVDFNLLANGLSSINDLHMAYIYRNGLSPDGNIWSENTFNNYIEELKSRDVAKEYSKHFFRNALRKTHNLSISGGGEKNTYFASLGYTGYESLNVGNEDDRITLTVNNSIDINDKIKFTSLLSGAIRNRQLNSLSPDFGTPGATSIIWQLQSYDRILDENGNLAQYYTNWNPWLSQEREAIVGSPHTFNWLDERLNTDNTNSQIDLRTRFQIDAEVLSGLTVSSAFSYDIISYKSDIYRGMNLPSHRNFINDYFVNGEYQIPLGTDYEHERNERRGWVFRNSVNWDKSWGDHDLTIFALGEYQKSFSDNIFNRQFGYDQQSLQYAAINETLSSGVANFNGDRFFSRPSDYFRKTEDDIRQVSYASNLAYTYADKYTLNGSVRVDQANLWGSDPEFRYKPLWSVAAGWELGDEDFMDNVSWVNRLKLRASYGIGGISSQTVSPYAQAFPTSIFWGRQYAYTRLSVPANPSLRWGQVATTNIGMDFTLFNSRISGSAEYYMRKSSDILGRRGIDPTTGFTSATLNYAGADNKGFELQLSADIIPTGDFKWNLRANFNYNKNILTDFSGENSENASALVNGATFIEGDPFFTLYAYRNAGLNENGDVMVAKKDGTLVHWRDIPNEITVDDMVKVGSEIAPYYGGLFNNFSYKNFDLSVLVNYQAGHVFKDYVNYGNVGYGTYNNTQYTYANLRTHKIWNNRWREPGDEAFTNVPRITYQGFNPNTGQSESRNDTNQMGFYWSSSDINYHKADFIRVQEVILGYNLSKTVLDRTFLNSLRLSLQVTNPYLWTANKVDRDPQAVNQEAYTNLTRYTLGLRATF